MSSFWTMCVGRLWSYLLNRAGWASLNFKQTKWKYLSPRLSYVLVLFDSAIMTLNLENSPMNSVGEDGCSRQQPSSSTGPSGCCTGAGLGTDAYGACAGRDVTGTVCVVGGGWTSQSECSLASIKLNRGYDWAQTIIGPSEGLVLCTGRIMQQQYFSPSRG